MAFILKATVATDLHPRHRLRDGTAPASPYPRSLAERHALCAYASICLASGPVNQTAARHLPVSKAFFPERTSFSCCNRHCPSNGLLLADEVADHVRSSKGRRKAEALLHTKVHGGQASGTWPNSWGQWSWPILISPSAVLNNHIVGAEDAVDRKLHVSLYRGRWCWSVDERGGSR